MCTGSRRGVLSAALLCLVGAKGPCGMPGASAARLTEALPVGAAEGARRRPARNCESGVADAACTDDGAMAAVPAVNERKVVAETDDMERRRWRISDRESADTTERDNKRRRRRREEGGDVAEERDGAGEGAWWLASSDGPAWWVDIPPFIPGASSAGPVEKSGKAEPRRSGNGKS